MPLMGVQYPVGAAQVTFVFTLTGDLEPMVTTMGVVPVTPMNAFEIADIANDAVAGPAGPFLASQVLVGYTYLGARASLKLIDGFQVSEDFANPQVGVKAGGCLPSNCAELWDKRSALGGRKNRGRCFVPPCYFSEVDVDARGTITATKLSRQLQLDNMVDFFAAADLPLAIFHSDGAAPTMVTAMTLQSTIATQRDRMR